MHQNHLLVLQMQDLRSTMEGDLPKVRLPETPPTQPYASFFASSLPSSQRWRLWYGLPNKEGDKGKAGALPGYNCLQEESEDSITASVLGALPRRVLSLARHGPQSCHLLQIGNSYR